jgi:hypothetical protein
VKRDPSDAAGAFVREHSCGELDERAHVLARQRFVEAALGRKGPRSSHWLRPALVIASFAALLATVWLVHTLRAPITFARGASRTPGVISEFVVSSASEEQPLYFSDGSVVTMASASRARVERTTSNGALLVVESGGLSANIVHRATSDWRFLAGPYSVHVTGTAFILDWRPTGILEIEMKSGVVVVQGPGVESGVEVRGRRRFVVPGAAPAAGPSPDEASVPPSAGNVESSSSRSVRVPHPASSISRGDSTHVQQMATPTGTDPPESWTALVARGEYSRVLELANDRGLDGTLASASMDDLSALGDAARFSGARGTAERALRSLRSRFPGTGRSEAAAFLMGRIADDAGETRAALGWYERYLNEAPGGSLAAEALGRRMLALRRLKDSESARRAALEYIQRFPTGPHAPIARDIAGP